jgi:GT2 family glycosyltransferase
MSETIPVSIVIPTIGRVEPLRACLESIANCDPPAAEVLVVDQSGNSGVAGLVAEFEASGARVVPCSGRGISLATNLGLREARHEVVAVTHDDCTVARSWAAAAWKLMNADPSRMVTGRVVPGGDPRAVPVQRTDPEPREFADGSLNYNALMPMNTLYARSSVLAFGGYDERFDTAAEDKDLCYRWLLAGRRMTYEPELVVWHHDVRSHKELERVYVNYWRGTGKFFAKHLWLGDLKVLNFMAADVYESLRHAMPERLLKGRPRWTDWRRGLLRGLFTGFLEGLWTFRPAHTARASQSNPPRVE